MNITDHNRAEDESGALAAQLAGTRRNVPNLIALKKRVDGGDTLSDLEIADMEEVFERSRHMLHVYDEHPEVQELVARVVALYLHITTRAVENETARQAPPAVGLDD